MERLSEEKQEQLFDARVEELISQMTLAENVGQNVLDNSSAGTLELKCR